MTPYWETDERNQCSVCSEPLDTEEEKDRGVHEGCDPIDRVSGVQIKSYINPNTNSYIEECKNLDGSFTQMGWSKGLWIDSPARDQAYYSRTTPNQQLQDACDKAAEILAQIFREARERAMWLSRPDGQGGG